MELVGKGEVLWSETRGNRSHLLLSGQPSPSTASSSKVLRVVTSDFQNFHLTANKVCDWMKILLSKYYTEETKPFNLYLFEKRISGSLWFICLCLVWSYQQVITGQNCRDIFHYKWLYYWRKVRFAVIKSIQCRPLSLNCFRIRIEMCRFYVDILHFFFYFKKEFLEQQNF